MADPGQAWWHSLDIAIVDEPARNDQPPELVAWLKASAVLAASERRESFAAVRENR